MIENILSSYCLKPWNRVNELKRTYLFCLGLVFLVVCRSTKKSKNVSANFPFANAKNQLSRLRSDLSICLRLIGISFAMESVDPAKFKRVIDQHFPSKMLHHDKSMHLPRTFDKHMVHRENNFFSNFFSCHNPCPCGGQEGFSLVFCFSFHSLLMQLSNIGRVISHQMEIKYQIVSGLWRTKFQLDGLRYWYVSMFV